MSCYFLFLAKKKEANRTVIGFPRARQQGEGEHAILKIVIYINHDVTKFWGGVRVG